MNKNKNQWIVMHCLDAFHDADGKAGQHKIPLKGYDKPMNRTQALEALAEIERKHPEEDFSIRKIAPVIPIKIKAP